MRSRYSAYAMEDIAYLLATWHPSTAPGELEPQPLKWLGLEIQDSLMQGDVGVVEFVARYRDRLTGRAGRLHEISRFVREGLGADARWLYVDGTQPADDSPADAVPTCDGTVVSWPHRVHSG
jgi:SEC-C motif domain protein